MKRFLIPALGLCAIANATTLTIPTNGSSVYFQENPSAPGSAVRSLGQTFVTPSLTETVLTDFGFFFSPGTDASFDYRAYVFQWDTATLRATGPALFTSSAQNGSQAPSFAGLNIALDPTLTYIALLTTEGVVNNGWSGGLLYHNSANVYAGGAAYQQTAAGSNGSSGTGSWASTNWSPVSPNSDFQFSATFTAGPSPVPEPASVAMTMMGAAAILGLKRMRTK